MEERGKGNDKSGGERECDTKCGKLFFFALYC